MLENDEWQSCMHLTRVRLADAVGLAVSDERVEDGEWRWLMIQPILWEAVACCLYSFHISSTLLVICSDPRSHYLCVLAPMWNTSLQIFV